ncbi:MAG: glycosyltransferase family A protein [Flavobacteriaceae bacterium]
MPKFSVVIAVYNKEQHIGKTVESVLAQTFTDFEIIIVNDGSTDGSEAIIKSFNDKRIHYYKQENQGAAAGRNAAIKKATGPFIALLDADDFWEPKYLEVIKNTLEKYPNEHVFATAVAIETRGKTIKSTYSLGNLEPGMTYIVDYFEASSINTILTSSSTVLQKSVFDKIGFYDSSIKSGQDTDLWIRIGLKYKIVFINTFLVTYRFVKQSLSNKTRDIASKPTYDKYIKEETKNKRLKKFLDLNRYSLAILAKLKNDRDGFKRNFEKIDLSNLNKKQRLLLRLSPKSTRFLYNLKNFFERFGIRLSAFQ